MQVLRHAHQRSLVVNGLSMLDGPTAKITRLLFTACLIMWALPGPVPASGERPVRVRQPAVAGLFYPASPEALRHTVQNLLQDAGGVEAKGRIRGLVSPHAGYIYSGPVAAAGYRQIDPAYTRVVILGPSHRVPLAAPSIADADVYRTPLGDVPLAETAAVLRRTKGFDSVSGAHAGEHSIEVQLPFLQVVLGAFEIVPILINRSDPKTLAGIVAPYVDEETLVVASSDLSHYYPYETAREIDEICTKAVVAGRFSDMPLCEACGKKAVETLMHLAVIKGWQATCIDYKNSGDTAGGKDRVVGYASMAFVQGKETTQEMKGTISSEDRAALLKLARSAIEAKLADGAAVQRPSAPSPVMGELRGCFVTLHKGGRLRGCIGNIEPAHPLVEGVERNARNAAFHDPRFKPLSAGECKDIDIEISVLTVPETIDFTDGEDLKSKLLPRVHGVILSRGTQRATFLPQVWEQLPDKEQFLQRLCLKGGMPAQAWQDPQTKVQVYRAEVFGEKEVNKHR